MADNQGSRGQRESYTLEARICARRDLQEANLESTYAATRHHTGPQSLPNVSLVE